MGAFIKATGVATDPAIRSSIALAAAAAKECLRTAEIDIDDVGYVINVGVYRDDNMLEPAMAAIIQKEIGSSLDYVKSTAQKSALGFDLMNGGCGILNAIQVATAFLATGSTQYVLIVSSDAHPSNQPQAGFPYTSAGAAMLLAYDDKSTRGFGRLMLREQTDATLGVEGFLGRTDGRHGVTVQVDSDFSERALILATETVSQYAEQEGLDLARTRLVTSQITPTFGIALADALKLDRAAVVASAVTGDTHSSALTLAYHSGATKGRLTGDAYDQVLFVGVAAGPMSGCIRYTP